MKSTLRLLCACVTLIPFACCQSGGGAQKPGELPANASVTVFPVLLGERAVPEVANFVGIFLERGGLNTVEVEAAAFTPEKDKDLPTQAAAFGAFVGKRSIKTEYALFAAILGTPGKGIDGLRAVLVDKQGKVAWSEQQQKGSKEFDEAKPREPMDCLVLLAQRLTAPLHLTDPLREGGPETRLEQRMNEKSGLPSKAEREAIDQRLAALRKLENLRLRVYPCRVGESWSADGAKALAAAIEKAGIATATVAAEPLPFTAKAGANEQVTLWSAAKSIQAAVRKAEKQADYLLFTDYLMAGKDKAGAVHTFLLDPAGNLVVVDFQNDHHADFQKVAPASVLDCSRLAAIRLAARLAR